MYGCQVHPIPQDGFLIRKCKKTQGSLQGEGGGRIILDYAEKTLISGWGERGTFDIYLSHKLTFGKGRKETAHKTEVNLVFFNFFPS